MASQSAKDFSDSITKAILNNPGKGMPDIPAPEYVLPDLKVDIFSPIFSQGVPKLDKQDAAPGFIENASNHFVEHNEFFALNRFLNNTLPDARAPDITAEEIPDGWTPYDENNIVDIADNLWDYILDSRSPAELEYRRARSLEQMQWEEKLNEAGWFSALTGSIAGIATSPTTYMFPIASAARYATIGRHVFKGIAKVAPSFALSTAAHEGIVQLGRLGGNLEDAAINTMRDTAFGLGFYGAGRGLVFGAKAVDVWKARRVVNLSASGIATETKVGLNGEYEGLIAKAIEGENVTPQALKFAQEFLDNRAVLRGLSSVIAPIGKIPKFGSDLIQGLASPWATVRKFTSHMGNQSIVTGAIERGIARPRTAEEILNEYTKRARQAAAQIHGLYLESRGLKPGITQSAKQVVQTLVGTSGQTKDMFFMDVLRSIFDGIPSKVKEVNEAARIWEDLTTDIYKTYLEVYGYPTNIKQPRTSVGYATRNYNVGDVATRPGDWQNLVVSSLEAQDTSIKTYMEPMNRINDTLSTLYNDLKSADEATSKTIKSQIRKEKRLLQAEQKKLDKLMRDGLIDEMLLEERPFLTTDNLAELKQILKPISELDVRIRNAVEELPGLTRLEQKASRAKIKELRRLRNARFENLLSEAEAGRINPELWYVEQNKIKFHNIEQKVKFRELYSSRQAMIDQASTWADAITNMTPEQLAQGISTRGSLSSTPDSAKMRSVMIKDIDLLNAGFLDPNIENSLQIYARTFGKRIALKQVFADMNWHNGPADMLAQLKLEYDMRVKNITDNTPSGPEQKKTLGKVKRQFDKGYDFISNYYNYYMGNSIKNNADARFRRATRNWTSITMLGKVPLLQAGELAGMIFKQRLWPFVSGGLVPSIERINSNIARAQWRANAQHAYVGVETELGKFSSALFDNTIPQNLGLPTGTIQRFEAYLERASGVSSSIFMTNFFTNAMQTLSANITQSRVMGDLFKAAKGTLSKADAERLLINGINPKDAKLFISQYKAAKGFETFGGGHVSKWYEWASPELRGQMRRAIVNDIEGSILQAGLFDKPLWMRDSIIGMPFQFLGYVYAAFNKFTMPLAQTPDIHRILGLVIGAGYGMMIEPMRAFVKGQPFEVDEKGADQWIYDGFSESGMLGYPIEIINTLNAIWDVPFLNRYKQDRLKRRSAFGILGGPTGGLIDNIASTAQMFIDGRYSQQGLNTLLHTSPIPINLVLDGILRRVIQQTDLPEKRSEAQPYSWLPQD